MMNWYQTSRMWETRSPAMVGVCVRNTKAGITDLAHLIWKRKSYAVSWIMANTGTGCPEKLWMPPPWKCSSPGWMELWAAWSSGRCPRSWQRGWNQM